MARNNSKNEFMFFEAIQSNMKLFLSGIIILNFVIIILLKLSIKAKEKFSAFFDNEENQKKKETLLVIAHPDDEVMFFGPTVGALIKKGCKVRVLCLSNGNADSLGKIREVELEKVCKYLGVSECEIVANEHLQDDIYTTWDATLVSSVIKGYLDKNDNIDKIGTIISFDEEGVTKHPNHISCCNGLLYATF